MQSDICSICPRECRVDRKIKLGFCNQTNTVKIARASLHFWEEPCISGECGSGTIFFSGCNLKCIYCQNRDISSFGFGKEISIDRLFEIFYELKDKGANNINFVTPTHFTYQILSAIDKARASGFDLPFVWNTSGYEKVDTIKDLKGYIDIFLTDFKYYSQDLSYKYSLCKDYFDISKLALNQMVEQSSPNAYFSNGIMKKGVIVRHLLLPGHIEDSKKVLSYLFSQYENSITYSLMNQYTPPKIKLKYENLNRKVTKYEYDKLIDYANSLGITNAFIQVGETAKDSFIPDFNLEGT